MASGITYNIAGKYNPKGEKEAVKGISKLTKAAKSFNMAVGGFVISKVFHGISKVVKGSTEEFIKNDKAIKKLNISIQNNVKLTEGAFDRLKSAMDEVSGEGLFGGDELANATALASQMGLNEEAIRKVLDASTEMASAGIMPLETAVKNLSATYGGNLGQLQKLYPELKGLTKEQLKNGEAVDILKGKYDGFRESLGNTFEGQDIKFQDAFGNLQEKVGGIIQGLKFESEKVMIGQFDKMAEYLEENKINILKFFLNMPSMAQVVFKACFEILKRTFTGEGLTNLFTYIGNSFLNIFKYSIPTIWEFLKTLFFSLNDLLDFLIGNNIRIVQDKISEIGNFLIEKINEIVVKVMDNKLIRSLYEFKTGKPIQEFQAIKFRFQTDRSKENKTWDETKEGISEKINEFVDLYKKNFRDANKTEREQLEEFVAFYSDITEGLSEDLKEAFNKELPADLMEAIKNEKTIKDKEEGGGGESLGLDLENENIEETVLNSMDKIKESFLSSLGEVGEAIKFFSMGVEGIKAVFSSSTGIIGFIIQLVIQFVGALRETAPAFNTFLNMFSYIFNIIASTIAPLVNNIFLPLVNILRNVGMIIGNFLIPVFNTLNKVLTPIFELVGVLVQTLKPFLDIFVMLLNLLVEFDPILNLIATTVKFISDLITFVYNKIIRPVLNGVIWVFAKVGNFFIGLYNKIVDILHSINIFGWRPFGDMNRASELDYDAMSLKEIATDDYKNHREELETGEVPVIEYNPDDLQNETLIPVVVPDMEDITATVPNGIPNTFPTEGNNNSSYENNNAYNPSYGNSASYTAPRDININIEIGNVVGSDGMREFSLMIRDEIKEAEALGR